MSTSVNSKVSGIATGDILSDGSVPFTGTLIADVCPPGLSNPGTWAKIYCGSGNQYMVVKTYAKDMLGISGQNVSVTIPSDGDFGWSSTTSVLLANDVRLWRDAAGALAQRNSTNAQTFRIYNTYTDASNYERSFVRWASNVCEIGTEFAGTGYGFRAVRLGAWSSGSPTVYYEASNNNGLQALWSSGGNLSSLMLGNARVRLVAGTTTFLDRNGGVTKITELAPAYVIVAKTANYTVTNNDCVLQADATAGNIVFTLPPAASATPGQTHIAIQTDVSGNTVTWDGNASETIDGSTTLLVSGKSRIIRNTAGNGWLTW